MPRQRSINKSPVKKSPTKKSPTKKSPTKKSPVKSPKGPKRAKIIKLKENIGPLSITQFSDRLLKIINVALYDKLLPINREYCMNLKYNNTKTVLDINGKVTKGKNEFDENGFFVRGACKMNHYEKISAHTHFEGLPNFPSSGDIIAVLHDTGKEEYIFTVFGFWYLHNVNAPRGYIENKKLTQQELDNIYFLNHYYLYAFDYHPEKIHDYINKVKRYVDDFEITFTPWDYYFKYNRHQKKFQRTIDINISPRKH
jgi:hypothetical protein